MILTILIVVGTLILGNLNTKSISINDLTDPSTNYPASYIANNQTNTVNTSRWKTYAFDKSYILPNFILKYPSDWEEHFCFASGCWNINLKKDDRELLIDISGQGKGTFQQSLEAWITNFGSYNISYIFNVNEQGTLTNNNRNYIIYQVTEAGKAPYIIAIVDAAEMYEGRGHLAIKASKMNDLDYVKAILDSIHTL